MLAKLERGNKEIRGFNVEADEGNWLGTKQRVADH